MASRGGKVEILLLDFHFSTAFVVGAVGMWESRCLCEISKGLVERVGSPPLAFHAFHSPGISTAPFGQGNMSGYFDVPPSLSSAENLVVTEFPAHRFCYRACFTWIRRENASLGRKGLQPGGP